MKKKGLASFHALQEGYQRFLIDDYPDRRALYQSLVSKTTSPKICFVACCDAHVDPLALTDSGVDELFVIRNVANLVPPFCRMHREEYHATSAALQYAVMYLKVEHIVVLGHSHCGGINALMTIDKPHTDSSFISDWVHIAEPAKRVVKQECQHMTKREQASKLERMAMQVSIANLESYPDFYQRISAGLLHLHAWHFDVETGMMSVLDRESGDFYPLLDQKFD